MVEEISREAMRELNEIRHPSFRARVKEWGKSLLGRGNALGRDPAFWPAGLLLLGLTEAGHIQEAEEYLSEWLQKGSVVQNPDDALTGTVLLSLYEQTGNAGYAEAAGRVAVYLKGCLRDAEGSIVYGQRSGNSWIYADGAGMTSMFLTRYARILADGEIAAAGGRGNSRGRAGSGGTVPAGYASPEELRAEARRQLMNFARFGMDGRSCLPYHGYDLESGVQYGIIGWGRAVGWLLMGLSEYVMAFPEDGEMVLLTQRLCAAICERIRPDGMLSWQLDCMGGPLDTSATGMIFYSLLRMNRFRETSTETEASAAEASATETSATEAPAAAGIPHTAPSRIEAAAGIPYTDPARIKAAAEGLAQCVTKDGKVWYCSAECIDFAQYLQQYGNYCWGQGSVLAFLALAQR